MRAARLARSWAVLAALAAVPMTVGVLSPRAVYADASTAETDARRLFQEGRALMDAGRFADACPKFEASLAIYDGIGTRYNFAECLERVGRIASAWTNFVRAATAARVGGEVEREQAISERARALESRLPKLEIDVDQSARIPGLVVRCAGERVGPERWGQPFPIDPGRVVIEASAPASETFRIERTAIESQLTRVAVPKLTPVITADAHDGREARGAWNVGQVGGATVFALGVVALGLGTYWGIRTKTLFDDSGSYCSANDKCRAEGVALRNDALASGDRSTVAFVVGGVLALTGAALWLTLRPSRPLVTAGVAGDANRVSVQFGHSF